MTESRLTAARARLSLQFEQALAAHVEEWRSWPPTLAEACRYMLESGGKRVRPLVAMLAAEAVGGRADDAVPWAMALELVHTYSLVHDDLPAMDDDDVRRGRPSCHVAYGEAMAILAGDALLTEAFRVLGAAPWPGPTVARLVALLGEAAGGGGMVGGQVFDIAGSVADLDALVRLQRMKTGALFRAAASGGALAGGGDDAAAAALLRYGDAIGLLFQLTDDILDRDQDAVNDGSSYFHHLPEPDVLARRDALVESARRELTGLPAADALRELAELIAHRNA
jgi:geranylgeranyl diphosphate synthase type II